MDRQAYEHLTGAVIGGKYKLLRYLTTTKMSVVYQAVDIRTMTAAAVKIHLSEDSRHLLLFEREAELARLLRHPHLVSSYDHNMVGVSVKGLIVRFIALQWVDGISLHEIIDRNRKTAATVDLAQAAVLIREIADALSYAHQNRIIHRDVKPTNILVDVRRGAMLIDFGIARIKPEQTVDAKPIADTIGNRVESLGIRPDKRGGLGAVRYRSPEQVLRLEDIAEHCDQYSLAITLYEYVTNGISPYQEWMVTQTKTGSLNDPEYLRSMWNSAHLQGTLTPLHQLRPDVSEATWLTIKRALEREPKNRFPSVAAFATAFERSLKPHSGARQEKPAPNDKSDSSRIQISVADLLKQIKLISRPK